MDDQGWPRRLVYGARQAIGLGLIAGALEVVGLASGLQLPLSAVDMLLLGFADVLILGIVGGVAGALAGLVVHPLRRDALPSSAVSLQLAGAAALLCGLFLWQGALTLWAREQPVGAAAMAVMPLGFAGVVYFNARYWLRRVELQRPVPVGWLAASGGLALVLVIGAAALYPMRATGGSFALEGDRNVVIVTVDGLRADDELPRLRALADRGVSFVDAVSPSPHSTPGNATVLTGLHPLRHRVVVDGDVLSRGYRTLAETLEAEGYATGGFVSSRTVDASTGLSQGFRVFDDDLSPLIAGAARINLVGHVLSAWVAVADPERTSSVSRRTPEDTAGRFLQWLDRHRDVPFFGWVHLSGPLPEVDRALGQIVETLQVHGITGDTMLVVAGAHGEMRGEHGLTGAHSLYDPAIRVPLVLVAPGVEVEVPVVEPQVRTTDVLTTVLDWLRLDEPGDSEGVSLVGYAQGQRKATIWCSLVGEDADGELHIGMRNNGVKYIRTADGAELLHDLGDDPGERDNLADRQPKTLASARDLMGSELAALRSLLARRGR